VEAMMRCLKLHKIRRFETCLKKQNAKPKEKTYEQVESYFLWLIGKYGDYTSKTLMQKANILFKEDTSFNEKALNHLLERGVVDDLRYSKPLTLSYSEKNIGPNKIKQNVTPRASHPK
jgi:regulatory protein